MIAGAGAGIAAGAGAGSAAGGGCGLLLVESATAATYTQLRLKGLYLKF